jgi:hypothetical protein
VAWTVRHKRTQAFEEGATILALVQGLLAEGVQVYGSSDGASWNNPGIGAVNYWVTPTNVRTTGAWIRLRFPAVGGVSRELRIARTGTRRWSFFWSAGPTYFTDGASATVPPSCPTAADMQSVQAGNADFEYTPGLKRMDYILVTGDAAEGYSFFFCLWTHGLVGPTKVVFLDVVLHPEATDADPAVYGVSAGTTSIGAGGHTFLTTDSTSGTDNIAGWFDKNLPGQAWVAWPWLQWGFHEGLGTLQRLSDAPHGLDIPQGCAAWRVWYGRGNPAHTTQVAQKGRSRLFFMVPQFLGSRLLNAERTLYSLGRICIPWDGTERGGA